MWILESRGEFLQGKRVWLKPGQRYLFGRVKKDGVFQAIDHKGVSRRQFVIDVEKVNPGDGSRVHTRSKVVVTDENSRGGTYVDGNLLKGTSHELKDAEHHIRLGIYPHVLTIKWLPVCLSFFLTSKEKKKPDPLGPQRHLLEPLDIKTVLPFLPSQTTHVVAAKRNTVPGLQALISGKYIVDHSYIDALVFAATPEDLEEAENLSPLEKDFDTAWPDPLQHLPPKGREPTAKPSEAYKPNPARENIFDGWTFIFLESGQYETILPAITTGHGKALLFKLESGKTTAEEIIAYMRNAAGEKSFGSFDQSTDSGGVIMIKPTLKEEWTRWGNQLANEVALALGQNYIDQADFLDAILGNDAASLRKVIPFESIDERTEPSAAAAPSITIIAPSSSSLPPVAQVASHPDGTQLVNGSGNTDSPHPTQESPAEPEAPVPKRRRTRAALVSRFKAFDDEFDIDTIAYEPAEESMESQTHPSQHEAATPISAGEELSQLNGQTGRVQKRARSPSDDPMVDQFLPAATAMKKRRLEISQENRSSGLPDVPIPAGVHNNPKTRKRQQKKEIDVRAAARERREAEEEAARRDQENLEANAGELSVEEMKNLAVVVEMEVPLRNGRGTRVDGSADGRWDEKWNGRKNFKKFRRKGEAGGTVRRQAQDVIVPLEEVKRKNFGIGEAYWSSSRDKINDSGHNSHRKSDFASQLQSQTQTQTQSQSQPLAEKSTSPKMTRLQQEAAEIVGAVDVDRPRQTRLADKTQQSQQTMNSRGKRPASSAGSGTAKRQRTIRTRAASETESDEELRFKFGSRKR